MPAAKLKLYRVIPDAWSDGLRAWCEAASRAALSDGTEAWLIVGHRAASRWIRERALRERVLLFGIRFLDPEMLRDELCARLGVPRNPCGDETAEFILKVAASGHLDADSAAVAREPASCLSAMSELRAAGWTGGELDLQADAPADFVSALSRSGWWKPEMDRALRKRAEVKTPARLWSCFVGWDAERFPDLALLEAAALSSSQCDIFFPMPHVAAEKTQQLWIETVEARLGANHAVCNADEGFHSANDALVSRLEKNALAAGGSLPQLLIGRDWHEQIALVRNDVIAWLARESTAVHSRVAIIAPERSPSSVAIVRALAGAGVAVLDEVGEMTEPAHAGQIAEAAIRYHFQNHDAGVLLEICSALREMLPETWRYLDPAKVHDLLTDAFCTAQSRNARLLTGGEDAPWRQIEQVVASLGKWDGELSWDEARRKWAHMLAQLGIATEIIEPFWTTTRGLLKKEKFSARSFLELMAAVLAGRRIRRAPEAAAARARVVVCTLAGAGNQTWSRVIFLDSSEGVWPRKPEENPLLGDAGRAALNARRGRLEYLLTSGDRWALEQAGLVDLIEHCSGEIVFAASARDPENPSRETQPNEWVLRCMTTPDETKPALARWRESARICAAPATQMPDAERAHLQNVHASRRDPAAPFDRYLFNFHESQSEPNAWSATRLDLAVTCPATFAMREIFHAEAVQNSGFHRSEGAAIGTQVHRWLAAALGGREELQPFRFASSREALEREIAKTLREKTAQFEREGLALPLWWETCLRKAAWSARRCVAPLSDFADGWFCALEKNLLETVETSAGPLRLKGRVDLLLADNATLKNGRIFVVDFKTGKSDIPTPASLDRGNGHQFSAYFLMAKNLGAKSVSVGIIKPDGANFAAFSDEHESFLRQAAAPFSRMQRDKVFGRRGPLVAEWGACERLPLATVPIDPEVLEQKAARSFSTP